nr:MAG TPA: hypothetical protein [Caudoviricetes sp.]
MDLHAISNYDKSIQDNFLRRISTFSPKIIHTGIFQKSLNSLNLSQSLSEASYHQNHILTKGKPLQSLTEPFRGLIIHFYPLPINHHALALPRALSLSRRDLIPRHLCRRPSYQRYDNSYSYL